MLKPAMNELMKRVGNRYLLVNLVAQRARDIAEDAEDNGESLRDKVVKQALDEIAAGTIVHRPGKKPEEVVLKNMRDISLALDLDFDEALLEADEEPKDEQGDE